MPTLTATTLKLQATQYRHFPPGFYALWNGIPWLRNQDLGKCQTSQTVTWHQIFPFHRHNFSHGDKKGGHYFMTLYKISYSYHLAKGLMICGWSHMNVGWIQVTSRNSPTSWKTGAGQNFQVRTSHNEGGAIRLRWLTTSKAYLE